MPRMALYCFLWSRAESLLDSYRCGSKASRSILEALSEARTEEITFLLCLGTWLGILYLTKGKES